MPSGNLKRIAAAVLTWFAPATAGLTQQLPPTQLPPPRPTVIGMNAPEIRWYSSTFPFANLMIGSDWLTAQWGPLPDEYQDKDGNIVSLPANTIAQRWVSVPPTSPAGIEIRCTYSGSGSLILWGGGEVLASAPGSLRFRVVNQRGKPTPPWLILKDVDARRPFRDLDCRETRLAPSVRFRSEFLATLRGYGVIRFMDWQNANANEAVRWADRHVPAGNRIIDHDGVPIEDMMALVRELGADPWFVMPWNADDAYIAGFARLVRDQLPPGRQVYVEVGNEVWNGGFAVARQAVKEGRERKLGANNTEAGMRRYAQRTSEVMRLWEAAFAGRPGQKQALVRVLSTQHVNPETARIALSFEDTAAHVDALATAPYFGTTFGGTDNSREKVLAMLSADVTAALKLAVDNRRIAVDRDKRYLAYEGGEGLALPAQQQLLEQLQHDPAQYELYRRYLAGWRRDVGDVLCLLTSSARTGVSGAWGLQAWEDETEAEAPKLRAVREAMVTR